MSMLTDIIQKSNRLVGSNSTTILTVMGVSGVMTTAYLTGKASMKAARMIDDENNQLPGDMALTKKEEFKLVATLYIPPVVAGVTTVASIIMANQIASKKIAALAVASGISERAFQEYKAKVVEKIGQTKATQIRDEVAQDRVANTPTTKEVLVIGAGDVLCFDMMTGRYFQSTVEKVRQAENKINFQILNHLYASLSEFYDEIDIPPTPYSDTVGWNGLSDRFEVKFSTVMSPDQRPCVAIDFEPPPGPEYTRTY